MILFYETKEESSNPNKMYEEQNDKLWKTQRIKFAHIYITVFSLAETKLSFCFLLFCGEEKDATSNGRTRKERRNP